MEGAVHESGRWVYHFPVVYGAIVNSCFDLIYQFHIECLFLRVMTSQDIHSRFVGVSSRLTIS